MLTLPFVSAATPGGIIHFVDHGFGGNRQQTTIILVAVDNIDISILSVVEKETIFGANKATESKRPKKHIEEACREIFTQYVLQ